MYLITYISDYKGADSEIDAVLDDIIEVSKRNNEAQDITGVLFCLDGKFLQVIEGEEASLRTMMVRIEADPRHDNIKYLIDSKIKKKGFRDWKMDRFHLNSDQTFSHEEIQDLTESFKNQILPRADMLAYYYKTLMQQKTA